MQYRTDNLIRDLKMNTINPVVPASFSDCGYQAGRNADALQENAAYLIDTCVKFPDELQDNEREQLTQGLLQYRSEKYPAIEYAVIDGNYLPVEQLPKDAKIVERKKIGLDFAFSYSQHEVGQLAKIDAGLHAIVKAIRKSANTYVSDRIKDLQKKGRELIAERSGKPAKTRDQATNYDKWLSDTLATMKSRAKTATARGDATVPDPKKLDAAIIAFKTKLGL
jgi:hypothetical protein